MEVVNEEKTSFMDRLKSMFGFEQETETQEVSAYHRRLLDSKIERYLDENFNNYIAEYGLVRELDLMKYEERYDTLVNRTKWLDSFMNEADGNMTDLEKRVEALTAATKGSKKK